MRDICSYRIEVRDQLDEYPFNARSPQQIRVVRADEEMSVFTTCTDQAGLIGLLRQLHGQGFTILSVAREQLATNRA